MGNSGFEPFEKMVLNSLILSSRILPKREICVRLCVRKWFQNLAEGRKSTKMWNW